jgi:hypothetical protein
MITKKNQTILSALVLKSLFTISMIVTSHMRNKAIAINMIDAMKRVKYSTRFG